MTSTNSLSSLIKRCFRLIGILTFLLGFLCVLTALDSEPLLAQPDRILGLSTRGMLLMVAVSCLALGVSGFALKNLKTIALVHLWVVFNVLIYVAGMLWTKSGVPFPVVVLPAWKMGIWPKYFDIFWILFLGGVVVVSVLGLIAEKRESKARKEAHLDRAAFANGGFTRIELVLVLALSGLLFFGAVIQIAGKSQESSRRTRCQENLRRIGGGLLNYANDRRYLLPDCTANNPRYSGGWWPWDLHTNLISDLAAYQTSREVLYCPSNWKMNDDFHWNFWRYEPVPFRIVGYGFLLNGISGIPFELTQPDIIGRDHQSPANSELVVDTTISMGGEPWKRGLDATANAQLDYTHVKGKWVDSTSHLKGFFQSIRPAGGNIVFLDGHVQWRDFREMQHRFTTARVTWDY
jgi:prepilin-type processing-associated H-X9-DG protein